jgi:hypothetical protein
MANFRCMIARRCRFIARDAIYLPVPEDKTGNARSFTVKPGFEALAMAFKRNRVMLTFDITNISNDSQYREPKEFVEIREGISAFCDAHATGMWTWSYKYSNGSTYDTALSRRVNEDIGTAAMTVQFENEQDIDVFLRQCAVIIKLTY